MIKSWTPASVMGVFECEGVAVCVCVGGGGDVGVGVFECEGVVCGVGGGVSV